MSQVYELDNVVYAYGEKVALTIDKYTVEENTVNALLGANGSGKSTLLNLLAFISVPSRGRLFYFNERVENGILQKFRRQTAYVQQKPYLFNLTVRQNIELGLKLRGVDKYLRHERADLVASKLQLTALLHKRAHELSGGETQKVAIARALVMEPRVLLLDEPFTYLDRQSRTDIENLIRELARSGSQTIIFSSHDHVQAHYLADHICTLDLGEIRQRLEINTFNGKVDQENNIFNTGKLEIHIPATIRTGTRIVIDSTHLVLSRKKLQSSMRNQYQGRVTSLRQTGDEVHVIVEASELWHIVITHAAMEELGIVIGEKIWLSFKSTAVQVFE